MATYALIIEGECIDLYHVLNDSKSYIAAFPSMFEHLPIDESVTLVDTELYTAKISRTE